MGLASAGCVASEVRTHVVSYGRFGEGERPHFSRLHIRCRKHNPWIWFELLELRGMGVETIATHCCHLRST